jgi:hypothetical protein
MEQINKKKKWDGKGGKFANTGAPFETKKQETVAEKLAKKG